MLQKIPSSKKLRGVIFHEDPVIYKHIFKTCDSAMAKKFTLCRQKTSRNIICCSNV